MPPSLKLLPRYEDCHAGYQWYVCNGQGKVYSGCCSINPCDGTGSGCPASNQQPAIAAAIPTQSVWPTKSTNTETTIMSVATDRLIIDSSAAMATQESTATSSGDSTNSAGAMVAAILGSIAIFIIFCIWWCSFRRRTRKRAAEEMMRKKERRNAIPCPPSSPKDSPRNDGKGKRGGVGSPQSPQQAIAHDTNWVVQKHGVQNHDTRGHGLHHHTHAEQKAMRKDVDIEMPPPYNLNSATVIKTLPNGTRFAEARWDRSHGVFGPELGQCASRTNATECRYESAADEKVSPCFPDMCSTAATVGDYSFLQHPPQPEMPKSALRRGARASNARARAAAERQHLPHSKNHPVSCRTVKAVPEKHARFEIPILDRGSG